MFLIPNTYRSHSKTSFILYCNWVLTPIKKWNSILRCQHRHSSWALIPKSICRHRNWVSTLKFWVSTPKAWCRHRNFGCWYQQLGVDTKILGVDIKSWASTPKVGCWHRNCGCQHQKLGVDTEILSVDTKS